MKLEQRHFGEVLLCFVFLWCLFDRMEKFVAWNRATATVVDMASSNETCKRDRRGGASYPCTYFSEVLEFKDEKSAPYKVNFFIYAKDYHNQSPPNRIGRQRDILYYPANPREIEDYSFIDFWMWPLILGFVVWLLVGFEIMLARDPRFLTDRSIPETDRSI